MYIVLSKTSEDKMIRTVKQILKELEKLTNKRRENEIVYWKKFDLLRKELEETREQE